MLEEEFSVAEIWEIVKSCDGNRAPGPDGFNMTFFKQFWKMVKDDVVRVFNDFDAHGKILKGLNAAFITLNPKTASLNSIGDFRPVSLIGSIYKLNQFVCTHGKQIIDWILIANEVVDSMQRQKDGGLLLKIDFAKAYDNIDWGFLFSMLKAIGFGSKWIL